MNAVKTDIDELVARLDNSMGSVTRSGAIRRFYQQLAAAAGAQLERSSYLVLKQLVADGPTRITDLAVEHGVEPSTMSRHTKVLEDAGLVVKRPYAEDGRVALAETTAKGRRLVARVEAERAVIFAAVLSSWEPDDSRRFVELFERFNLGVTDQMDQR
ncbi:MAG: MarR family winged helix-turn-helix transcriptional regulator [Acidimicrobiia bacterium]